MGRPNLHRSEEFLRRRSAAANRRWRELNPERHRANYRARNNWKKYGLSEEQWLELRSKGCGICGSMEKLVIDHNHDTGVIRGALCTMHNTALGKFNDSADELRKAIAWLEGAQ